MSARTPGPQAAGAVHRAEAQLYPGDVFVSAEPSVVRTILGSCVAVCVWDMTLRIGGVNHFLLPAPAAQGERPSARYADFACRELVARLRALGSRPAHLSAKVFGGARIMDGFASGEQSLGAKNVAAALRAMKDAGIPVVASETGGRHARKLLFLTDEGTAFCRSIERGRSGP